MFVDEFIPDKFSTTDPSIEGTFETTENLFDGYGCTSNTKT